MFTWHGTLRVSEASIGRRAEVIQAAIWVISLDLEVPAILVLTRPPLVLRRISFIFWVLETKSSSLKPSMITFK